MYVKEHFASQKLGLLVFMSRPPWPVPPGMTGGTFYGLSFHPSVRPSVCPSFRQSCFRGTTLHAAPSKNYTFSTNYHACIAMQTWPRCAPPILCWPWPPYNLLPRSCLTWIFFVDPRWWAPLCMQRPAKALVKRSHLYFFAFVAIHRDKLYQVV